MSGRVLPVTLALLLLCPAVAQAQLRTFEGAEVLQDPEWRKRFLGSYGFLSGAEPAIRPQELELLREVIDLMRINPEAAAQMLSQQATEESSAALDFVLANLYFQNGALPEAVTAYENAIAKFPDFRRAHKNLGLLMVQKGDFERAAGHFGRATELGDRDGRTLGLLGYCYLKLENPVAAEIAYRNAILQEPDTLDWQLGLTRALLAIKDYDDAAALIETLIRKNPENPKLWLLQANAYIALEKPLAAAANLEFVRMMGHGQPTTLALLGDIYLKEGMFEDAKEVYVEIVRQDDEYDDFEAALRAADLLHRTEAFTEADDLLATIQSKYAKKMDTDAELRLLTLQAKSARARGDDKKAAKILESVVARDGTNGEALLELSSYYASRGDSTRAVMLLERTQKITAFEYRALIDHAQLLVAERDYEGAAKLLKRALNIRSEPRIETYLARVEQAAAR